VNLEGRSLCKEVDLSADEFLSLVELARALRDEKRSRAAPARLRGRNLVLVFEKTSTRTRASFEVAAHDQGAAVTVLRPGESQLGAKESVADTARVLGRLFDAIAYRGGAQEQVESLAAHAGVPVYNALTDAWHPTQMLADVLTMTDEVKRPVNELSVCYLGDTRNNTACSLLVTGAMLGFDVRLAGPPQLWPAADVRELAAGLAAGSGASTVVTDDPAAGVRGVDFVYTDVWVSMGEPATSWGERIGLLLPYQVNGALLEASGNPSVKLLHCLPAMHDLETDLGRSLHDRFGLDALEVTDEVFESPASLVFDEAENRMHSIKALLVATMASPG
jgi:ornithine carbamoyltransferase